MSSNSISVVINTKNAAATVKKALDSVQWAQEIIVMDMHSEDETEEIAKTAKAQIFTHPDVGYVEPARNKALEKATGNWILVLDADEEVPPSLAARLKQLAAGDATADAYFLPRKNIVFSTWYQYAGWWPDYQLRFFKNGVVTWSEEIHQPPHIQGSHDHLAPQEKNALIHHNYQTVEQFLTRLNRYTSHEVSSRDQSNTTTTSDVISNFNNELMARLFKHKGIDGGVHGVGISYLQAMYELVVRLKQWQSNDFPETQHDQTQTIAELRQFQSALNYWIADWQATHTSGLAKLYWLVRKKLKI